MLYSQVLPALLRWLLGVVGLRWALGITGALFGCVSFIGLLFRPIDPRALALLDLQQHAPAAASAAAASPSARDAPDAATAAAESAVSESSEPAVDLERELQTKPAQALQSAPPPNANELDPSPVVVDATGEMHVVEPEQPDVREKLLAHTSEAGHKENEQKTGPAAAANASPGTAKPGCSPAATFAYFRHMPLLLCSPTYLLHAVHFACFIAMDLTLIAVSFDSFVGKELKLQEGWVYTLNIVYAIGNLVGRFGSGLFLVLPTLLTNYQRRREQQQQRPPGALSPPEQTSCFAAVQRVLKVRVVYCTACGVVCVCVLLLALAGLYCRGGALVGWELCLACVYVVMGFAAGCAFSQFPVVLAELVGVQRLAAGHALFMFIQAPTSSLPFICGLIQSASGSWGLSYLLLFAIICTVTVLNSIGLLFGARVRRLFQKFLLFKRHSDPAPLVSSSV